MMTVAELIKRLQQFDPDMEVVYNYDHVRIDTVEEVPAVDKEQLTENSNYLRELDHNVIVIK